MDDEVAQAAPVLGAPARRTMTTSLADRLVTAIAVGVYSPGERLPSERELVERLGVSRVTVRQALQHVASLGLIESRRGRGGGTFVCEASWEEIAPDTARRTLETELPRLHDLFDYRCLVEAMIARAAAERRTEEDVRELHSALTAFATAGSMSEARAWDRRLHGLVCAAARNPHLTLLSAQLTAAATLGFGAEPYEPEFVERARHDHSELVDLVAAGDVEGAGRSAREHFTLTLETMRAGLRRASERA